MATFRPISTEIWRDRIFQKLDTSEKMFWLYLLTNHTTKQCGIYRSPASEMSYYCGLSVDVVNLLLKRFEETYNLIKYDDETEEVCIVNWFKHHQNDSPNVLKCIAAELKDVESYDLVKVMQNKCRVRKIKALLLNKQKSLKLSNADNGGVAEGCEEGEPSQMPDNQQYLKQLGSNKEKEEEKEEEKERARVPEGSQKNESSVKAETEETPQSSAAAPLWIETAKAMAGYFQNEGSEEWRFLTDGVSNPPQPIEVCREWAGKHQNLPRKLNEWRMHTGKLAVWIKNISRNNNQKSKSNGQGNSNLQPGNLITEETARKVKLRLREKREQAERRRAEMYREDS